MDIKKGIFVILLLINSFSWAQEFTIFSVNGKGKIIRGKEESPAMVRSTLDLGDKLKLEKSTEVILIHKSLVSIKIDKNGTYSIKDLSAKAEKMDKDPKSAYLEYVWKEFTKPHKDVEKYYREHMKTKGAVNRGSCSSPLMITPADGSLIKPGAITFLWNKDKSAYRISIFDKSEEGKLLLEIVVKDLDSLTILTNSGIFKKDQKYYWVIQDMETEQCYRYSFEVMSESKRLSIQKEVEEKFGNTEDPLILVQKASYYEQIGWFEEAEVLYHLAVEKSGNNDTYLQIKALFLARIGRLDSARQIWH